MTGVTPDEEIAKKKIQMELKNMWKSLFKIKRNWSFDNLFKSLIKITY
jgi:hypothetical protein